MTKYHRTVCLLSIAVAILTLEIKGQTTIAPQKPTTPKLSVAQNLNKAAMECQSRLGVNQAFMSLLSTKNIPTNEKMRCFLLCVYETLGLVKDNKFIGSNARLMAARRFAEPELSKANQLIDVCEKSIVVPSNSTEFCALGRLVRKCFKEEGEKIDFFPRA
uniref:Odorant binding protein 7 n=1 Tax=Diaphorina citri TaxID=121845 RepID=A0A7T3R138_DIACI|nr:odorant binding protein 7 [Diaphorina citri]